MNLYPAVAGPDDITNELDHWEETHTANCTVINVTPPTK